MKLNKDELNKALYSIGVKKDPILDITLDDINSFGNEESIKKMQQDMDNYTKMLNEKIILVNESISSYVPFTRENLYLFCAYTGSGKSTVAANISYPLWKLSKKVLVISNEEKSEDILGRIACLELKLNFNDYKHGKMTQAQIDVIKSYFGSISQYIKVLGVDFKDGATTRIESVQAILEQVKAADYSCVLIDYFQLIKNSISDPTKKTYFVLEDFSAWLGRYIKTSNVPIAVFVQLHSQSKRPSKGADIDTRIKDCPKIIEPATVIIEVVPNFEDRTTDFIIHKARFGNTGERIVCPFDNGRFLRQLNDREVIEAKLDKLQGAIRDEKGQSVVPNLST